MTTQRNIEEINKILYGINVKDLDYFGISNGNLTLNLSEGEISFETITEFIKNHGFSSVVLRIPETIDHQLNKLYSAFNEAIKNHDYKSRYNGVFPVKVNHKAYTLKKIAKYGAKYNHGWEIGTKSELIIVISLLHDKPKNTLIICNGTKDKDYINAILLLVKKGYNLILTVESKRELLLVIKLSESTELKPSIGLRFKMDQIVDGHWGHSSGLFSKFGISAYERTKIVRIIKDANFTDNICLIHGHIGSQINDISYFKNSVFELMSYFQTLWDEGCHNLTYLDFGGGLGIDYGGNNTSTDSSISYSFQDYADVLIKTSNEILLERPDITSPVIITESGRAITAKSAAIAVNIIEQRNILPLDPYNYLIKFKPLEDLRQKTQILIEDAKDLITLNYSLKFFNSCLKDIQSSNEFWKISNSRLEMEYLLSHIKNDILQTARKLIINQPILLETLTRNNLTELTDIICKNSVILVANFSVFNSVCDVVLANQYFPILPITGLDKQPDTLAKIVDITCDSDGEIGTYITKNPLLLKNWNINDFFTLDGHLTGHPLDTLILEGIPLPQSSMKTGNHMLIALTGAYMDTVQFDQNLLGGLPELEIVWYENQIHPKINIIDYAESNAELLTKMKHVVSEISQLFSIEPQLHKLLYNNPYMDSSQQITYDSMITRKEKSKSRLFEE